MKYSILIPAYKAKYLEEAIDSVLQQTYKDLELIIVNDASPENIDDIISQYEDSRLHYFKNKKNCGALRVVDNWNKCLEKVRGEFVICMGDDDKLLPECLEIYDKLISEYPGLDVYHGWTEIIDEHSHIIDMQEPRPIFEGVYSAMWGRMNGRQQFIGDFLFRVSPLREAGGFYYVPMAWGSDDITSLRAMIGKGVANTQLPVFQYRKTTITLSSSSNGDLKMRGVLTLSDWELSLIMQKNQELNSVEAIYLEVIRNNFDVKLKRIQKHEMFMNFRCGIRLKKLLFWYQNKKKYRLNNRMIFISFIRSLNKM